MQHMSAPGAARIVTIALSLFAVFSVGGLIATAAMGIVGDRYGAYGEIPIPGSGTIRLPSGEVLASFHVTGYGGRGLTVPPLTMNVTAPEGGADGGTEGGADRGGIQGARLEPGVGRQRRSDARRLAG